MIEVSAGTLTDFLLRRIADEAEAAARALDQPLGYRWRTLSWLTEANRDHGLRWDPARVLAECEAKRRIVALCSGAELAGAYRTMPQVWTGEQWMATGATDHVLLLLALPYAGHAEFNPAWRL